MDKVAFENLTPMPVTIAGESHILDPAEYARICMCAVKGKKQDIKMQILISRMDEKQLQALDMIAEMAVAYEGNVMAFTPFKSTKRKPPPGPERPEPTLEEKVAAMRSKLNPKVNTNKVKGIHLSAKEFARICPCEVINIHNRVQRLYGTD